MDESYRMFIDAKWADSSSGERIDVRDPSTVQLLCLSFLENSVS
jgi:hypothetical protein